MAKSQLKDRVRADRFWTHPPRKEVLWTFFVSRENTQLFTQVGKIVLEKRPWLDIALVTESPGILVSGGSAEERMGMRSDLSLFDTRYLLKESMFGVSSIIHLASRKGITSVVLLYSDERDLRRVKADLERYQVSEGYSGTSSEDRSLSETIKTIRFPTNGNDAELSNLVHEIENSADEFYKRKTFICHASEDRVFCERLAQHLVLNRIPVWYDEWSLKVGDSLVAKINEGIQESQYMGIVLSKNSVDKPWCVKEMNSALYMQLSGRHITVLPIRIDDCQPPPFFAELLWADFRTSFEEGLQQLLRAYDS